MNAILYHVVPILDVHSSIFSNSPNGLPFLQSATIDWAVSGQI